MDWSSIIVMILEGMIPLVCLVCGVLLIRWLKKKGVKEDELNYIQTAYSMLTKAVMSTNQIWVDAIKQSEGKLTVEQQAEAREKTTEIFKEMITDNVKLAIEAAYGSVEKWLDLNLESAVGEVKALKNKNLT